MAGMSETDRRVLIIAIATREGTAEEISERYGRSLKFLRSFVETNKEAIRIAREGWERTEQQSTSDTTPTPIDLENLWIADKTARLQKLQAVAELLYQDCIAGGGDAAALREFRSYCAAAANELGQLLHRGAGDSTSDTLNVDIQGVNMDNLR